MTPHLYTDIITKAVCADLQNFTDIFFTHIYHPPSEVGNSFLQCKQRTSSSSSARLPLLPFSPTLKSVGQSARFVLGSRVLLWWSVRKQMHAVGPKKGIPLAYVWNLVYLVLTYLHILTVREMNVCENFADYERVRWIVQPAPPCLSFDALTFWEFGAEVLCQFCISRF